MAKRVWFTRHGGAVVRWNKSRHIGIRSRHAPKWYRKVWHGRERAYLRDSLNGRAYGDSFPPNSQHTKDWLC